MSRPSPRRFTILLLLALAFVAPWHTAAEAADPAASPRWQSWELAQQLWDAFLGLWEDSGRFIGPSGGSEVESATTTGNHGCSADPNGICG